MREVWLISRVTLSAILRNKMIYLIVILGLLLMVPVVISSFYFELAREAGEVRMAEAMAMNIRFNVPFSGVTRADYMRRVQFAHQTIDDLAGKHNVQVIDPAQILCPNFDCIYQHEEYPLYADRSHLSVYGARHIAPLFESVFSGSVNAGR